MKLKTLVALVMFGALPVSFGQDEAPSEQAEPSDRAGLAKFWEATLQDGQFLVALDKIASISRHKYVLEGALIVDEVTVDSVGQALARFYYISPITSEIPGGAGNLLGKSIDRVNELASDKGINVQNMVAKKYPNTTHAKSIEFRILSEEQLTDLFNSAVRAWKSGKGRVFTAN